MKNIDVIYMERSGSTAIRRWISSQLIDSNTCIFHGRRLDGRSFRKLNLQFDIRIFLLRDIFNHTASIIRSGGYSHAKYDSQFVAAWIKLAKHFVEQDQDWYGKHNFFINFNRWFKDIEYRKSIVLSLQDVGLGVAYKDCSLLTQGHSSFNTKIHDTDAVLNRWQNIEHDKLYKYISKEAIELNKRIFEYESI